MPLMQSIWGSHGQAPMKHFSTSTDGSVQRPRLSIMETQMEKRTGTEMEALFITGTVVSLALSEELQSTSKVSVIQKQTLDSRTSFGPSVASKQFA